MSHVVPGHFKTLSFHDFSVLKLKHTLVLNTHMLFCAPKGYSFVSERADEQFKSAMSHLSVRWLEQQGGDHCSEINHSENATNI